MEKLYRILLIPGLLTLMLLMALCPAYASEAAPATSQTAIATPRSGIETVPADDVPIEQAPSSRNSNDTMLALLEFVVLWSVIYIVIKMVRKKLEKDRPFK